MKSWFSKRRLSAVVGGLCCLSAVAAEVPTGTVVSAVAAGQLGLAPAAAFRITTGKCDNCAAEPAARWYFRDDYVAVPTGAASGFEPHLPPQADVRQWAASLAGQPAGSASPLVWIGSPQVLQGRFAGSGMAVTGDAGNTPLQLVPKIEANRSYWNEQSRAYFADRPVKLRGTLSEQGFVARSIWPADFALKAQAPQPLAAGETLEGLVRADGGGATQAFASRVLWQREAGKPVDLAGKAAMAFVLNGAQGDDDEAHGGHFAVATGKFGAHGEWDDWLVNNFYNLDIVSEKGIVAATLPMDSYQGDLNSGQSWYRPSYVLVAVFKDGRGPALYQEAIDRVMTHFYRHDFRYNHATANCAGINLETLRSLGWQIPEQGATSRLKAWVALPFMAFKDGDLESGRKAYEYLSAERTDLYPFTAFTAAGEDLLQRLAAGKAQTDYERQLASDLEAIVFVRLPQFPSSRAFGQAPVASIDEYMSRVPADRSQWQVVPVPPQSLPAELKDPQAPAEGIRPSSYGLAGWAVAVLALVLGGWRLLRRRRVARSS